MTDLSALIARVGGILTPEEMAVALPAAFIRVGNELDKANAEIERLRAALKLIASMGNQTLIGGDEYEPRQAYSHGAHNAFEQAAEIASAAIATSGKGE